MRNSILQRLHRTSNSILERLRDIRPDQEIEGWIQPSSCQIENLSVLYHSFFSDNGGFFVEVGAHDGHFASNSYGLVNAGWSGIQIEPIPNLASKLRSTAATAKGKIIVHEGAVAATGVGQVVLTLGDTLTSANPLRVREYKNFNWSRRWISEEKITVPARSLTEILDLHNSPTDLEVLMIDVEGFERDVMSSFDFEKYRPQMLIIELSDFHPDITSTRDSDRRLYDELLGRNYVPVFKDSVNTVLVDIALWKRTVH